MSSPRIAESTRKPSADTAIRSAARWSIRLDKCLRKTHGFGIRQRLIQIPQRVRLRADGVPGNRVVMPFEDAKSTDEVPDLASPAPTDFEMLAVYLVVRVDGTRTRVRVVTGDHVAAAVADEIERLFDRARRSGRLDCHIDAQSVGQIEDRLAP